MSSYLLIYGRPEFNNIIKCQVIYLFMDVPNFYPPEIVVTTAPGGIIKYYNINCLSTIFIYLKSLNILTKISS